MSAAPAPAGSLDRRALSAALVAYLFWGLMPLLFRAGEAAGSAPLETVAWRITASAPLALLLVVATGRLPALRALAARPRALLPLALSAALAAVNWTVYVSAVDAGRTLDTSLGYYILPLINLAAGAWLFGERLDAPQWAAAALAGAGVALQAVAVGGVPWVSLAVAFSFAGYGIVRKRAAADAQTGLFVECALLLPLALGYIGWLSAHGHASFGASPAASLILLLGGPATALPLFLFAVGARGLPLTLMGFLQFISPTLQFALGLEGGERLSPLGLVAFGFIWAGVAVFVAAGLVKARPRRRALPA